MIFYPFFYMIIVSYKKMDPMIKETLFFSILLVKSIFIIVELLSVYYTPAICVFVSTYTLFELIFVIQCICDFKNNITNIIINGLTLNLLFLFVILFYQTTSITQLNLLLINVSVYSIIYLIFIKKTLKVSKEDLERYTTECIICLENMTEKELKLLSKLSCNHVYHSKCIEEHFNISNKYSCPTCRKEL